MGMFDYLRVEVPLPAGRKPQGPQTKEFGCNLQTHIITKDGRLMVDKAWKKRKLFMAIYPALDHREI